MSVNEYLNVLLIKPIKIKLKEGNRYKYFFFLNKRDCVPYTIQALVRTSYILHITYYLLLCLYRTVSKKLKLAAELFYHLI